MTRNKTYEQLFPTRPLPGQSPKSVYVYVFLLSLHLNLGAPMLFACFFGER